MGDLSLLDSVALSICLVALCYIFSVQKSESPQKQQPFSSLGKIGTSWPVRN
jgi:hypothetical protein